jgi:transcriptional regulator with XRE-family HTH domain
MLTHTQIAIAKSILPVLLVSFGDNLRLWRKRAGMTQTELAKASGVNVSYISNLERDFSANTRSGRPRASEALCERFSKILNVPLDMILLEAGHAPRSMHLPARNAKELIEALNKLGIEIGGTAAGDIADMTHEQFEDFKRDLEKAFGVTIALRTK